MGHDTPAAHEPVFVVDSGPRRPGSARGSLLDLGDTAAADRSTSQQGLSPGGEQVFTTAVGPPTTRPGGADDDW
jgi:hypothetical protein